MPRMRKKAELPAKTCPACGRPFVWRKRWARDWERVVYCSEACRRGRGRDAASRASSSCPGGRAPRS